MSVLLELIEVFGNLGDVLGVHNPQADAELLAQEFEMATPMQIIDGALQGVEKRSLAVATGAAHHHAELRVWLREVSGQRKQVGLSVLIKQRVAMPPLHLQRIVGSKHIQRLKGGHVEPKTLNRNLPLCDLSRQFLYDSHIDPGSFLRRLSLIFRFHWVFPFLDTVSTS